MIFCPLYFEMRYSIQYCILIFLARTAAFSFSRRELGIRHSQHVGPDREKRDKVAAAKLNTISNLGNKRGGRL